MLSAALGATAALFVSVIATSITPGEAIVILGALGGAAGLSTLYLAPRQGRNIAVTASESAVKAVKDAMDSLQTQLNQAREDLRVANAELERLRERLDAGLKDRRKLEEKVEGLKKRVLELESTLRHSRRAIDRGELPPGLERHDRRDDDADDG